MSGNFCEYLEGTPDDGLTVNQIKLEKEIQKIIADMLERTITLNHAVVYDAKCISDEFKQARASAKSSWNLNPREKNTTFRHRVRMTKHHTLQDEWFKAFRSFGEVKFRSFSRRGKYTYPKKLFQKQPKWVRDFAQQAEVKLTLLRQQNDLLFKTRKELYLLSDLIARFYRQKHTEALGISLQRMETIFGELDEHERFKVDGAKAMSMLDAYEMFSDDSQ